jgi:hypothetical protein
MTTSSIAFLFLMIQDHKVTSLWESFFQPVHHSKYQIYCHTKRPPGQSVWRQTHISRRLPTRWGDISLVQATLALLTEAYQDPTNQYFCLLSDSCLPVVDFQCLERAVYREGKTWLHYKHIGNRVTRYQKLGLNIRKSVSWRHFYSQHQWMILKRSHVKLLLSASPRLLPEFSRVHAVDEHYVVTLLWMAGLLDGECLNRKVTYCNWSDRSKSHPAEFKEISDKLVEVAQGQGCFFLRKVSERPVIGRYLRYILKV